MIQIDESWYRRPPGVPAHESAGGVVIRRRDGRIEFAMISEARGKRFVLPKGHLERGETPEQAAAREIAEEAGLRDLRLLGPLGARERLDYSKRAWKKTHYFLFYAGADRSEASPRREFEVHWFPLDDPPEFFWPEQAELVRTNADKIVEWARSFR